MTDVLKATCWRCGMFINPKQRRARYMDGWRHHECPSVFVTAPDWSTIAARITHRAHAVGLTADPNLALLVVRDGRFYVRVPGAAVQPMFTARDRTAVHYFPVVFSLHPLSGDIDGDIAFMVPHK